jgi:hypothetical protein
MRVQGFFGGSDECRMIGETEIVVGAHVEHALAPGNGNVRVLRTCDDALGFKETLRFDFFECLRNLIFKFGDHNWIEDYADIADTKSNVGMKNQLAADSIDFLKKT